MPTKTPSVLIPGITTFTYLELIRKAAEYEYLKLEEGDSKARSKPIATCPLDDELLAFLAKRNIKHHPRTDNIFTLSDENPQEEVPGWEPSNYWNFNEIKGVKVVDFQITLSIRFQIDAKERGIVLRPIASGSFLSPGDRLPNFRMFKALIESGKVAVPAVALRIARSEGFLVVKWTDLQLGGIRTIGELFQEFRGSNKIIDNLARCDTYGLNPFNPTPLPHYQNPDDQLFITEPVQSEVLRIWEKQLKEFQRSLNL